MFSEPQSVTLDGAAKSLNRLNFTANGSEFATADTSVRMSIQHILGRRHRHTIRLKKDSLVANPLVSGQNINQSISVLLTVDVPPGYDTAAAKDAVKGLLANLTASTDANITKLVGGES